MTALVAVHHLPAAWLGSEPGPLAASLDAFRERTVEALAAAGGRAGLVSDWVVAATFAENTAAVAAAFDLGLRGGDAHGRPSVVVGLGRGDVAEGPRGLEVARAWRLATVGAAGDVLCSRSVVEAGLPDGVGVFRAPDAHERLAGFGVHVLVDYR